jgi:transposase
MAYFRFKTIHGRKYLYIAESRRVGGRVRSVNLAYLGRADQALRIFQGAPAGGERLRSFEHGGVAVLLSLADRLGVVELIDRHLRPPRPSRPRRQLLSVGRTLLLAAIGRALHPTSKKGWAGWAVGTTVGKLWGFDPAKITSQFYWDQMDCLPEEELEALQAELAGRVRRQFGLSTDSLFYDVTNFFTFIDSRNRRCDLPQRGKNKQHRNDLRQFQLGLLVSRDGWVPLLAQLYRGNFNDLTTFPAAMEVIARQCRTLGIELRQVTLVADKGNISKANWELLDASRIGHVVSLTPGQYPDWTHRPIEDFNEYEVPEVGPMKLLCGQAMIAGRQRTVIVLDSPTLRDGQMRGLSQQFGPVLLGLNRLGQSLKEATRRRREDAIRRQITRILAHVPQVRQVLRTELIRRGNREGFWKLDWWVDEEALANLRDRVFGRRMLATDRHDWPAEQIVWAYWGQAEAELVFRQLKDPEFLALRPQYHWTDQKIQVHSFCCVLGYLLGALLRREVRLQGLGLPPPDENPPHNHCPPADKTQGQDPSAVQPHAQSQSLPELLKMLSAIRAVLRTESTGGRGRPRVRWQLEDADPIALDVYRHLVSPDYDLGTTPSNV